MRDPRYDIHFDPVQARALDNGGIRDLRRWFVTAARRSKLAAFGLICLYGAQGFGDALPFRRDITELAAV